MQSARHLKFFLLSLQICVLFASSISFSATEPQSSKNSLVKNCFFPIKKIYSLFISEKKKQSPPELPTEAATRPITAVEKPISEIAADLQQKILNIASSPIKEGKVSQVMQLLAESTLPGSEKAEIWKKFTEAMGAKFSSESARGKNGEYLFRGDIGEVLIIRPDGTIYKMIDTKNGEPSFPVLEGREFSYIAMTPYKDRPKKISSPPKPIPQSPAGLKEKTRGNDEYPEFKNYNDAMSAAVSWLRAHGFKGEMTGWKRGKISERYGNEQTNSFEGRTPDGRLVKVRIERHPLEKLGGATKSHINVSVGKEDGPHFIFPGGQAELDAILRQLFPSS